MEFDLRIIFEILIDFFHQCGIPGRIGWESFDRFWRVLFQPEHLSQTAVRVDRSAQASRVEALPVADACPFVIVHFRNGVQYVIHYSKSVGGLDAPSVVSRD